MDQALPSISFAANRTVVVPFMLILVIASVYVTYAILKKAKQLGLTMEYICDLPPEEREQFRKKNGF